MRIAFRFFFLLLLCSKLISGQRYTISGFITDVATGEKLISANVYNTKTKQGTTTNNYGFYSISLPSDSVFMAFSFVGYNPVILKFHLKRDTTVNIKLSLNTEIKEVTINGSRMDSKVDKTQMSANEVQLKMVKNLPVILGEIDLLKTIQLLPGVQSGTEGTSGFYVRGGGPDQNLILMDGVPVYNVNHLFGFFSVFNAEAINSATLIKGGFPARFGGRLSSVLDVRMKEGNNQKLKGDFSIGLIASRFTLEGPIIKDKCSFIVSARRTYIDVLAQPLIMYENKQSSEGGDISHVNAGYYFYDLNAKINYKFSDKNRLYLSVYNGDDQAYLIDKYSYDKSLINGEKVIISTKNEFRLKWGNINSSLRWNYLFSDKLFSNTTLTYSRYRFLTRLGYTEKEDNNTTGESKFDYISGIYDAGSKIDFDYIPLPDHYVKFGINYTNHEFNPGISLLRDYYEGKTNVDTTLGNKAIFANEICMYAEDDFKIGSRLKINTGVHFSNFFLKNKRYSSVEPRISANLSINSKLSAKAAFSEMNQYLHLLSNSTIGLPTDLWLPVSDSIRPQNSIQFATGFAYCLNNQIDISIEGFYKNMVNLIEYKEGASFLSLTDDWQQKIEIGKGNSYGIEFLIEKNTGKFTGWIGYTLSYAYRKFQNLNEGRRFPYKYDRRHDISLVLTYKFNERVDVGLTWVFGTGNATTLVSDKYEKAISTETYGDYYRYNIYYPGIIGSYQSRNSFRMPSYHRLDLGINLHKQKKHGKRTWRFGVYNVYNRQNPFIMMIEPQGEDPSKLVQLSLFPIIPSFSYRYEF
jgi:outer membrane receptor for ferrienterochelin and colicin